MYMWYHLILKIAKKLRELCMKELNKNGTAEYILHNKHYFSCANFCTPTVIINSTWTTIMLWNGSVLEINEHFGTGGRPVSYINNLVCKQYSVNRT